MRIAVTGGSGVLGREILEVDRAGAEVVAIAVDLRREAEAAPAFAGMDVIIHTASPGIANPGDETTFMRSVVAGAKSARVGHIVYVSIVNVDRNRRYAYYAAKADAEDILQRSGVGYTIQRSSQFHELVDFVIGVFASGPVAVFPPRAAFQPIATDAVARRLFELACNPPQGRACDIAGPGVLTMPELFSLWKRAHGVRKQAVTLPLPLPFARVIAQRRLINDVAEPLGATWEAWLRSRALTANSYATKGTRRTR